MAFNFDKYKANNPLLQETNDDPTVSNIDAYAETGGLEEDQSKGPLQTLEDAALNAKASNIELEDAINIVAQAYGKGMSRLAPSLTEK